MYFQTPRSSTCPWDQLYQVTGSCNNELTILRPILVPFFYFCMRVISKNFLNVCFDLLCTLTYLRLFLCILVLVVGYKKLCVKAPMVCFLVPGPCRSPGGADWPNPLTALHLRVGRVTQNARIKYLLCFHLVLFCKWKSMTALKNSYCIRGRGEMNIDKKSLNPLSRGQDFEWPGQLWKRH